MKSDSLQTLPFRRLCLCPLTQLLFLSRCVCGLCVCACTCTRAQACERERKISRRGRRAAILQVNRETPLRQTLTPLSLVAKVTGTTSQNRPRAASGGARGERRGGQQMEGGTSNTLLTRRRRQGVALLHVISVREAWLAGLS